MLFRRGGFGDRTSARDTGNKNLNHFVKRIIKCLAVAILIQGTKSIAQILYYSALFCPQGFCWQNK